METKQTEVAQKLISKIENNKGVFAPFAEKVIKQYRVKFLIQSSVLVFNIITFVDKSASVFILTICKRVVWVNFMRICFQNWTLILANT